ncbi:MAG: acyl-CoA dehydrogenase family protein [Parasphingorhabdus sp.]|nr:acyl-CoA dehydrogenase family protein [Parasphingorhabdus sp.]
MAILSEEQSMLREAARGWVDVRSPITAFRKMRDSGNRLHFDTDSWKEQAALGWAGVIIPEAYGGSDFGFLSMGLVLEELGRTLVASPLLASGLVAASAITLGGDEAQKQEWLPAIAEGTAIATLAFEEGAAHVPEKVATTASGTQVGFKISGKKHFVVEGLAADVFIVSARVPDGSDTDQAIELFLVRGDAPGLTRQELKTMDSRGYASLEFHDVEGQRLGSGGNGWSILATTLDRARAGLAAEMLGSATQAFYLTMDYLKTRVQFDSLIGSFQALQHRAARMFMELELARSAVEAALQAVENGASDMPELVSLAKAKVGETLQLVTNEMIQMHGGIGMTDEHDAGLFLKRARVCEAMYGNQSYHRNRYADILGY